MKKSKSLNWAVIAVGILGLFSSIFMFANGADFNSYFWGGFCGLVLIGTTAIELKEGSSNQREINQKKIIIKSST